jgi:hypothetical protein
MLPSEAGGRWRCELSGRTLTADDVNDTLKLNAADLFEVLPVALLTASKE